MSTGHNSIVNWAFIRQRANVSCQLRVHLVRFLVDEPSEIGKARHVIDVLDVEQLLEHFRPDVLLQISEGEKIREPYCENSDTSTLAFGAITAALISMKPGN
uniref:Uncharacterized protein n=1 Tax=Anopheles minimus TaxID=112268 RepID=A0A182VXR3_9DIPT